MWKLSPVCRRPRTNRQTTTTASTMTMSNVPSPRSRTSSASRIRTKQVSDHWSHTFTLYIQHTPTNADHIPSFCMPLLSKRKYMLYMHVRTNIWQWHDAFRRTFALLTPHIYNNTNNTILIMLRNASSPARALRIVRLCHNSSSISPKLLLLLLLSDSSTCRPVPLRLRSRSVTQTHHIMVMYIFEINHITLAPSPLTCHTRAHARMHVCTHTHTTMRRCCGICYAGVVYGYVYAERLCK